MTNVLLLTSSPRGDASYTAQVATELAHKISGATVTVRELWREMVPPLDPGFVHAAYTPADNRTAEQREALALSDTLIAELKATDVLIIASGMINFGVPSTLKSWIDNVTRRGMTFRYGEAGPEGLVTGKKTVLVLATGGVYSQGPMAAMDHQEPYLRSVLSFLGMSDIETILIEGVSMGPEVTEKEFAAAKVKAHALASALTA